MICLRYKKNKKVRQIEKCSIKEGINSNHNKEEFPQMTNLIKLKNRAVKYLIKDELVIIERDIVNDRKNMPKM